MCVMGCAKILYIDHCPLTFKIYSQNLEIMATHLSGQVQNYKDRKFHTHHMERSYLHLLPKNAQYSKAPLQEIYRYNVNYLYALNSLKPLRYHLQFYNW